MVTLLFMMGTSTVSKSDFEESTGAAMFVNFTDTLKLLDPILATSAYEGHMGESFDLGTMAKQFLERYCC